MVGQPGTREWERTVIDPDLANHFPLTDMWLTWDAYGGKRLQWIRFAEVVRRARGIPSIFD